MFFGFKVPVAYAAQFSLATVGVEKGAGLGYVTSF